MSGIVRTKLWDWQYLFAPDSIDVAADKIVESTKAHQELARRDYLEAADRLIVSQELSREIISSELSDVSRGLSKISSNVSEGLSRISNVFQNGISHLGDAIYDLNASFDWAAEKVIWHLAEVNNKLARPHHTQAMEFRQNGIYAFNNKWHNDAKRDFLKAEEYYPYDFVVHQYLGDIFLWELKDQNKAFEYYEKAAKYAEPISREVASWAKLHAALIMYFQKKFREAAKLAEDAINLHPSAEAHYQHAHYLVMFLNQDLTNRIIRHLELAIRIDSAYFLKIDKAQKTFEEDFRKIRGSLHELKKRLLQEVQEEAKAKIEACRVPLRQLMDQGAFTLTLYSKEKSESALQSFNHAVELLNRHSYLDYRLVIELCR